MSHIHASLGSLEPSRQPSTSLINYDSEMLLMKKLNSPLLKSLASSSKTNSNFEYAYHLYYFRLQMLAIV